MKYTTIITLCCSANYSAASVVWPGTTAPCDTTLVNCANNSPVGEVIEIQTNDIIDENVLTINAVSFKAGTGYKPVFAADNSLQIINNGLVNVTVEIQGLTFERGGITFSDSGTNNATTTLNIKNNHILDNAFAGQAIRVTNRNKEMNVNIAYNQINFNPSSTGQPRSGAITITNGSTSGSSSGEINGQIYNNTIKSIGTESVGIGIYEFSNNTSDLNVASNELTGGQTSAMYINKATGSNGISRLEFAHNAVYSNQVDANFRGLFVEIAAGDLDVFAINNSVVGAFDGFNFQESGTGELNIQFYSNLIAYSEVPVLLNFYNIADSTIDIDNDYNLFYQNLLADPDYVAGLNVVNANPKIKSKINARLKSGSPAIEAGYNLALISLDEDTLIDADGLYRVKKGDSSVGAALVDIGAYETGDLRIVDKFTDSPSSQSTIDSVLINNQANAKLQVTPNWNPNGDVGVYNDHNTGVYRCFTDQWCNFNQDLNDMTPGASFNVWSPAPNNNNFVHIASDATPSSVSFTTLDRSGLNNSPNLILSVTQFWSGVYNDNPVGAVYNGFEGKWLIENMNDADMPENAQFNVLYQPPSANAFVHKTAATNIFGSESDIDHPLLNGTPCAQFQVTHVGVLRNPYPIGVYYTGEKWSIFNQGGEVMAENNEFHVIVSAEQIEACNGDLIFADSFD